VHHQDQWWILYTGGWLRVEDRELVTLLNTQRQRFAGPRQ
jgi:hypothetical protein